MTGSPYYDADRMRQWYDQLVALVPAEIRKGDGVRNVARAAGVAHPTLYRQLTEGTWQADMVVTLARAFGQSPLDPLIWAGYLTPNDVTAMQIDKALDVASDNDLIAAV